MYKELKEVCNLIVGEWYEENLSQEIIFDLNNQLLRSSKMTIIDDGTKKTSLNYGIAILPDLDENGNFQFYIEIITFPIQYFLIKSISKDKLILYRLIDFKAHGEELLYIRKVNLEFSNLLLQKL